MAPIIAKRRTIPTTQTDASRVRQNFWQTAKPSNQSHAIHTYNDDISQTMPLHRSPNTQLGDTSKVQIGERSVSKSTIFFASLSVCLVILLVYNINPTKSTEGNANVVSNEENSDNNFLHPFWTHFWLKNGDFCLKMNVSVNFLKSGHRIF